MPRFFQGDFLFSHNINHYLGMFCFCVFFFPGAWSKSNLVFHATWCIALKSWKSWTPRNQFECASSYNWIALNSHLKHFFKHITYTILHPKEDFSEDSGKNVAGFWVLVLREDPPWGTNPDLSFYSWKIQTLEQPMKHTICQRIEL